MLRIDKKYNIELTRGDTGLFNISLTDSEGNPYTPAQGSSMRFAMGRKYGSTDSDVLINKDISIDTMQLEIQPEDTKSLAFGDYLYDIQFTDEYGRVSTVVMAKFTVAKEVY